MSRPLFVAPFDGERPSTVEVVFDPSGRIRYVDERPTDRNVDGILIERWEGTPTGAIRWEHHLPAHQFLAMDNPVKCAGCGGQPDVDERGTLWMLNTEPGLPDERLTGDILTATPPLCRWDARKAIYGCAVLREGATALRVTEADIVGVRGTVYSPNGEAPLLDQVVLFDEPAITRVVAGQILRRLSAYTTDETTLPELARLPPPVAPSSPRFPTGVKPHTFRKTPLHVPRRPRPSGMPRKLPVAASRGLART
ncbi:hypothetical protein [Streptomyces sp. cmx-4-7]|uniref:hypothetical protein n=1 Tax=Streptomyces sp. cmx-4-7 TaxID=2790939 RepID=UPI0039806966